MINSFQSNKGFSLVEMMVTLAISAIIIGAAFGSYAIIARNYDWQTDMKYMSQSARTIVNMIQKDIRNAGFRFESQAAISDPITIYDAGDCCDRIEIIYDETESKRIKIEYRLQQYSNDNSRFRLYKKKTNMTNNTVEFDSPIADYVEALQFTGSRGNCVAGEAKIGCGTEQLMTPSSARFVNHFYGNNPPSTCSDDILKIFDGDPSTFWSCTTESGELTRNGVEHLLLTFPIEFRPTKAILSGSLAGINGGSFDLSQGERYSSSNYCSGHQHCFYHTTHPWGAGYPTNIATSFAFLRAGNSLPQYADQIHAEGGWRCLADPVIENMFTAWWYPDTERNCGDSEYYHGGLNRNANNLTEGSNGPGILINPVNPITIHFDTNPQHGHMFGISYSRYLTIEIRSHGNQCAYSPADSGWYRNMREGVCNMAAKNGWLTMSDIAIYGEVFSSGTLIPQEVQTALLLRSPNEHGNVNRSFSEMLGNHSITKNDKYLRDSYTTSATARNMLYQSQ